MTLTPRQTEVLEFVAEYLATQDEPPRHKEIAAALRISTQRVGQLLRALERKGRLRRSWRVLKETDSIATDTPS